MTQNLHNCSASNSPAMQTDRHCIGLNCKRPGCELCFGKLGALCPSCRSLRENNPEALLRKQWDARRVLRAEREAMRRSMAVFGETVRKGVSKWVK